ncbi:ATP-dependent zinc protease [uncultured Umboniibacter sp.]|uniref:ATP-dependent zinc protease family protein n=1 Tax=uncultured Umboniibacter sp. TaxID=1798917 RepID=UPI002622E113|nr:ATP-dependent zinc protease [uncultured Umboniibacter sp.]
MTWVTRVVFIAVFFTGCGYQKTMQAHIDTSDSLAATAESMQVDLANLETSLQQQQEQLQNISLQLAQISESLSQQQTQLHQHAATPDEVTAPPSEPSLAVQVPLRNMNKTVLGGRESIFIHAANEEFVARIDTGAEVSSIHASNIELFERDGKEWVRFTIDHEAINELRHSVVERPIKRQARIRQANSDEAQERYVVSMLTQLGEIEQHTDFTLTDRSQLTNPILIGRDYFIDIAIVDVSREFIQSSAPGTD